MPYGRVLNKLPALNMTGLSIWEGYTGWLIWLNKPKYALIMSQYAWICLNNVEHNWICRHITAKTESWISQNFECVWCSTYYKVTVHCTEHCQTFKMEHFAKRIMPQCRCTTINFSRRGRWIYGTRALW